MSAPIIKDIMNLMVNMALPEANVSDESNGCVCDCDLICNEMMDRIEELEEALRKVTHERDHLRSLHNKCIQVQKLSVSNDEVIIVEDKSCKITNHKVPVKTQSAIDFEFGIVLETDYLKYKEDAGRKQGSNYQDNSDSDIIQVAPGITTHNRFQVLGDIEDNANALVDLCSPTSTREFNSTTKSKFKIQARWPRPQQKSKLLSGYNNNYRSTQPSPSYQKNNSLSDSIVTNPSVSNRPSQPVSHVVPIPSTVAHRYPQPLTPTITSPVITNTPLPRRTRRIVAPKPKIYIIGASQGRDLSYHLSNVLSKEIYDICSFIRPGDSLNNVLTRAVDIVNKELLASSDFIVILGGSNDLNSGKLPRFNSSLISDLVNKTNVIFCEIPQRFDVQGLENLVNETNARLSNCISDLGKGVFLRLPTRRDFFTTHGLHYNTRGKQSLVARAANIIHGATNFIM